MKAAMKVTPYVVMSIILLIVVIVFFSNFLHTERVQATSYTPPEENVECFVKSDCGSSNPLCLSINGQKNFCGCLDDTDCGVRTCIRYRCI